MFLFTYILLNPMTQNIPWQMLCIDIFRRDQRIDSDPEFYCDVLYSSTILTEKPADIAFLPVIEVIRSLLLILSLH